MIDAKTYESLPTPAVRQRGRARTSIVWVVPVLAVIACAIIVVRTYVLVGPAIHVSFEGAEGLEAGKTEVRYKNIPVGKVTKLELSRDLRRVVATIELDRAAGDLMARDTQFWVERPRVSVGGVSGLGTLLSGAYIGVGVGAEDVRVGEFVGLEQPPGVTRDQRGRAFKLTAPETGSLSLKSPVYLHHVAVGWVSAMELAADGSHVTGEVFIQHPYEDTVTTETVFWNASGLDVTLDASGLRLDTQSLATMVSGGLAYDTREGGSAVPPPAKPLAAFVLYADRGHAMKRLDRLAIAATMRFTDSMRGVSVGTGLDVAGVTVGVIDAIDPGYDPTTHALYTDVRATVYPERLGQAYVAMVAAAPTSEPLTVLRGLVAQGWRAQI
ncbi:MAG: MlaD family protein, partial [Proteobacteria bacterium]|nr:MlaD family protein [Pseudomonadota bacterium]